MRRYPGITPFKAEDAPVFKGRSTETQEVTNLILSQKTLILFAKSGMGKTSLLNAGVVPGLKRYGLLPVFIRFNEIVSATNEDPVRQDPVGQDPVARFMTQFQETYNQFGASRARTGAFSPQPTLWSVLCHNQFVARREVLIPTLIFDQFEEFFRTYPQKEQRVAFLTQLAELLSDAIPQQQPLPGQQATVGGEVQPLNLRVVFSIRSDMLNLMQEVSDYLPFVMRTRYELNPMTRTQATEAIREPGLVADGPYETGPITFPDLCVSDILTGVQDGYSGEIESFQLQLVCSYLEDKYVQAGNGLAATHAYTVVKDDYGGIPGIQKINEAYFSNTINTITEQTNQPRPALMAELIKLLNDNGNRILREDSQLSLLPMVKDALVDRRILKRDKIQGNTYYEVSHDKIATALEKEKVRIEEERVRHEEEERLERARIEQKRIRDEQERIRSEQEDRARSQKRSRNVILVFSLVSIALISLAILAGIRAMNAQEVAKKERMVAERERRKAQNEKQSAQAAKQKLQTTLDTLDNTIKKIDQARRNKAWSDFENAKILMAGKLFKEAEIKLKVIDTLPAYLNGSPQLINSYKKLTGLKKQAQVICRDMQQIRELVDRANCLTLDLKILCANKFYKEAKKQQNQYVNRYRNYCYKKAFLNDNINRTDSETANNLQSGYSFSKGRLTQHQIDDITSVVQCMCEKVKP